MSNGPKIGVITEQGFPMEKTNLGFKPIDDEKEKEAIEAYFESENKKNKKNKR